MIDTPPAITEAIRDVVKLADLVLIPTRPSPHDLRAVGSTVDIAQETGRPFAFAVTQAADRAAYRSGRGRLVRAWGCSPSHRA
ncbi:hypothetical protein VEE57_45260 (plasmid) [Escherichia coli]|nr:hypothetical protein VEE57_45260 [Escherichia coli]